MDLRDMLTMGEVHTGLLHHSGAVSADFALRLLTRVPGMRVRQAERPIAYALSSDRVTGVDCEVPTTGARVRGVGTIISRTALTGGHVLQGSAFVQISPGDAGRRLPWAHYLSRPGVVELLGTADREQLAAGFLAAAQDDERLDLGAIGARAMDSVQASKLLDHQAVLRSPRTQLRWAIAPSARDASQPAITFTVHNDRFRTLRLRLPDADATAVAALCEDLALHDWLLTTLLLHVNRAAIGSAPRAAVIQRLQPTIDHLLHLWMPAARVDPTLADLWTSLDRHPGLTRQWHATVDRIRDQLALATIEVLNRAGDQRPGGENGPTQVAAKVA